MQTADPARLLRGLLAHGAQLLIQLTEQGLFRSRQERQRR